MPSELPAKGDDVGIAPRSVRRGLALSGLLVALVCAVVLWSTLVTRTVEHVLSRALGAPVDVGSVDVEWLDRAVVVHELALAPGAAADARPLLTARTVRAEILDSLGFWKDGALRIGELAVDTADLDVESRPGEPSNLALLQDAVRGQRGDGAATVGGLRSIDIERAVLRSVSVHVTAQIGEKSLPGVIAIESGRIERIALPLPDASETRPPAALTLEGATLKIGADRPEIRLTAAQVSFDLAATAAGAGSIALAAQHLEADRVLLETVIGGPHPGRFDRLLDLWHAAVRGLDLPALASAELEQGRLDDLTLTQRDETGGIIFQLTRGSVEAEGLRYPESNPPSGSLHLRGHPLDPAASFDLRARGGVLDPNGERPIAMSVRFADVPLTSFTDLHLASGRTTGSAEVTLADGIVRGEATFRIFDIEAASDAPTAMRAGYASYDALAARNPPELTVPLSFPLSEPDLGIVFREVAAALARRLGGTVLDTAKQGVEAAGSAAQGAVEDLGRKARDAAAETGGRVQQGLRELLR